VLVKVRSTQARVATREGKSQQPKILEFLISNTHFRANILHEKYQFQKLTILSRILPSCELLNVDVREHNILRENLYSLKLLREWY